MAKKKEPAKLKATEVQTATARLADCKHVQIDVADTSRVIRALFKALGQMVASGAATKEQAEIYLCDGLAKGITEAKAPEPICQHE